MKSWEGYHPRRLKHFWYLQKTVKIFSMKNFQVRLFQMSIEIISSEGPTREVSDATV